ncbi:deazapurine DNA modification protein DpdA family protein [Amycolatopsis magusensis]
MGFTGWSQRDTLTTGHGHCRDNRRQHSGEVERVVRSLHARGLRLHCFGVKTIGLARYGEVICSSDSAAWSFSGRYLPGCTPSHRSEANCLAYALAWHTRLQRTLTRPARHANTRRPASRPSPRSSPSSRPSSARPTPRRTVTRPATSRAPLRKGPQR